MIRKLENTFTALISSAALLAVGLVLAQPAAFPGTGAGLASAATAPAELTVPAPSDRVDALADAAALTAELSTAAIASAIRGGEATPSSMDPEPRRAARKARRHHRQALVMPYFSFAPRG